MVPSARVSLIHTLRTACIIHNATGIFEHTAGVSQGSNTGAIVGGILGALAFITIIALLILGKLNMTLLCFGPVPKRDSWNLYC